MKKIKLNELLNLMDQLDRQNIKCFYSKYDKKFMKSFIDDPKCKINKTYTNFNYKNEINYTLLISDRAAILFQNKYTKIDKYLGKWKNVYGTTMVKIKNLKWY